MLAAGTTGARGAGIWGPEVVLVAVDALKSLTRPECVKLLDGLSILGFLEHGRHSQANKPALRFPNLSASILSMISFSLIGGMWQAGVVAGQLDEYDLWQIIRAQARRTMMPSAPALCAFH